MYILIPGRHHLITQFQKSYLQRIIEKLEYIDLEGQTRKITTPIEGLIFAVTSSNHSNTRRNPLPFYLRAIQIETCGRALGTPCYTYGIDDVGQIANFAAYTLKKIQHDSDGLLSLTPQNCLILCSTPVMQMYMAEGFSILPSEYSKNGYIAATPWDLIEAMAEKKNVEQTLEAITPESRAIWDRYQMYGKVYTLFHDNIVSGDGDITSSRDYNSYVREMDEIADLKFSESAIHIQPGRIGDIGCAVGSWIKQASQQPKLMESDFYGIEVSRHLFEICQQRKHNGDFKNPFVFFAQKNAVTGLVFPANSMNTIFTSSLTHEIESYGSHEDLLAFITNRYQELIMGGVWINRDVVGPENKSQKVFMSLEHSDGEDFKEDFVATNKEDFKKYLFGLSTLGRFYQFIKDFRKGYADRITFELKTINDNTYLELSLEHACEFLYKKDYIDNWESEMHETFCYWSFSDWKTHLKSVGFTIKSSSHAYTNQWIVDNRIKPKAKLYELKDEQLYEVQFPNTHFIIVAEK